MLWWRSRRQTQKNQPSRGIWEDENTGMQQTLTGAAGARDFSQLYQPSHSRTLSYDTATPYAYSTYLGQESSANPLLPQMHSTSNVPSTSYPSATSSSTGDRIASSSSDYSTTTSSGAPITALSSAQRKAVEARAERQPRELVLTVSENMSSVYSQELPASAAPATKGGWYEERASQPTVIVQHVDGGTGDVQELPPPYIGNSGQHPDTQNEEIQR